MAADFARFETDHRWLAPQIAIAVDKVAVSGPGFDRQEPAAWPRPQGDVRKAVEFDLDGRAIAVREAQTSAARPEET